MSEKNGGMAHPGVYFDPDPAAGQFATIKKYSSGMTLLDYFAAAALTGITSHILDVGRSDSAAKIAGSAYELGAAMLEEKEFQAMKERESRR